VQDGLSRTIAPLGDVAVVQIDGVKVVLNTHRTQGFGTNLFTQFGIDLAETKLIVVKSSQHFHAKFGPIASEVIYVETPGVASADLPSLPYKRARRTIWPLSKTT
jgi:microcystin degradation protein MlrC